MKQHLKDKVEACLERYPEARNSDKTLTIKVWRDFYGVEDKIALERLYDLPSQDGIKRIRATIQNTEGRLLPTSWEVAKKRHIEESKWREFLGYGPKYINQFADGKLL